MIPRPSSNTSDASLSMGERLLSGWTMLAEACDRCYIPLMRDPEGRADVCVGCGRQSVVASRLGSETGTAGVGGVGGVDVPKSPEVGELVGMADVQTEGSPRSPALRPPSPSSKLASKMLEGWKMLADHCPICHMPLCEGKGGEVRCVGCEMEVRRGGDEGQAARDTSAALREGSQGYKGKEHDLESFETLKERKERVMGRVLGYMEAVACGLGGDDGDDGMSLSRLETCADIVLKLDTVRLGV